MSRILKMNGRRQMWSQLQNEIILNNTVHINGFEGIGGMNRPVFMCRKLFVDNCDKNFIYYRLNKYSFPNVRELWLASHPTDPEVIHRPFDKIYLLDQYKYLQRYWAPRNTDIESVSYGRYLVELFAYYPENIKLHP